MGDIPYDEFGLFHENAEEWGLAFNAPPKVRRIDTPLSDGRAISGLIWGADTPRLVLLHGGAQNAHTYDTVALALGADLAALDLPGHGHSDGPSEAGIDPRAQAEDVAQAIAALCAAPVVLVGMSLGGLVAINIAAQHPDLVRQLVLIDITPGVTGSKSSHITDFINGPPGFSSFEELLERTIAFNPGRSEASLRRGILHNALQLDDGTWVWRWARHRALGGAKVSAPKASDLWEVLEAIQAPVMLIRGMGPGSVVDDEDEARLLRRSPSARIERVEGAGHSIQGDQPLVLAELIRSVID
jgi:pimeloyl-ACP methyl ester carboxylesterase